MKPCPCEPCQFDMAAGDLTPWETQGCDRHPNNRQPLRERLEEVPADGQWHRFGDSTEHWSYLRSEYNGIRQWNCRSSFVKGRLYVRREPGTLVHRTDTQLSNREL